MLKRIKGWVAGFYAVALAMVASVMGISPAMAQTELATLAGEASTAVGGDFTDGITAAASAVLGIIVLMAGIVLVFKLVRSVKRS